MGCLQVLAMHVHQCPEGWRHGRGELLCVIKILGLKPLRFMGYLDPIPVLCSLSLRLLYTVGLWVRGGCGMMIGGCSKLLFGCHLGVCLLGSGGGGGLHFVLGGGG